MSWFVVRTKPRQEIKAKLNLENQGFTHYLPELIRDNGKVEALFPGYIFIKNQAGPTPFDKIRSTYGVLNYVRFGDYIAMLNDDVIEALRNRDESLVRRDIYQANQKVRITDGPFKDLEAIYQCRSGKDRVILLLNLLNSKQRIEMPDQYVRSA